MVVLLRIWGTSLSTRGPGTSARMIYMECSSARGSTAMIKTRTPIPPIHWVRLRQKRRPRLMASTFVSMVAPVVVKPDTVSNTALT